MADKQTVEEILRNRVKFIGDGEWTLLGTPDDVIKELNQLLIKERLKQHERTSDMFVYENASITKARLKKESANLENQLGEKS